MKFLLISLLIAILFTLFLLPPIIRSYARTRSDQVIRGRRPCTEKLIIRCIAILTWSNKWITNLEEPDSQRIALLREMLKEMQHPHG